MRVSSDPTMAGYFRPVTTGATVSQTSTAASGAAAGTAAVSAGVTVDLRTAIQNLKPGMSYAIGGGYTPSDIAVGGGMGTSVSDKIRHVGVSNFMNAFSDWSNALSDYWGKVSDFTKKTFKVGSDEAAVVGGAANDIVRASLAARGVARPDMPTILKEGGAEDPYDASALAATRVGAISISRQGGDRNKANAESIVSFDRDADIPDDQMSIVDLDSGDAAANSLFTSILSGPLGAALSSSDDPAEAGMHRYAITNGKSGADGVVAAVLFTRGNDSADVEKAASLYATLKALKSE